MCLAAIIAGGVVLLAGGRVQVDADNAAFFANSAGHPVLAQFLRTGSCHVPGPDALAAELDAPYDAPDSLAADDVADRIEPREILNLTVMLDHDVIDGAPATRFIHRLVDLIESGSGLSGMEDR